MDRRNSPQIKMSNLFDDSKDELLEKKRQGGYKDSDKSDEESSLEGFSSLYQDCKRKCRSFLEEMKDEEVKQIVKRSLQEVLSLIKLEKMNKNDYLSSVNVDAPNCSEDGGSFHDSCNNIINYAKRIHNIKMSWFQSYEKLISYLDESACGEVSVHLNHLIMDICEDLSEQDLHHMLNKLHSLISTQRNSTQNARNSRNKTYNNSNNKRSQRNFVGRGHTIRDENSHQSSISFSSVSESEYDTEKTSSTSTSVSEVNTTQASSSNHSQNFNLGNNKGTRKTMSAQPHQRLMKQASNERNQTNNSRSKSRGKSQKMKKAVFIPTVDPNAEFRNYKQYDGDESCMPLRELPDSLNVESNTESESDSETSYDDESASNTSESNSSDASERRNKSRNSRSCLDETENSSESERSEMQDSPVTSSTSHSSAFQGTVTSSVSTLPVGKSNNNNNARTKSGRVEHRGEGGKYQKEKKISKDFERFIRMGKV